MKVIKTAVVGLGRIGWQFHIPQIVSHKEQFSLVGVVDVAQERLDEAKEKFGVNGYTDVAAMIDAEHPDLVVICSPTHLHPEHACTAMRMGCDVFLDKPMAIDYASAKQIADFAEESGRKLMVYQPHRAKSVDNQIKTIIDSGIIGKPYLISMASWSYNRRSDWQSLVKYGGGMLNNYGAHYIDLLLYFAQEKVTRLHCITNKIISVGDADDMVKAIFETESGTVLNLDISQAAALAGPTFTIMGPYGAVICQSNSGRDPIRVRWFDPKEVPDVEVSEELAAAGRKYNQDDAFPWHEEEIKPDPAYNVDFYQKAYEFYAEDKAPFVAVHESLAVMELIEKCHESAGA